MDVTVKPCGSLSTFLKILILILCLKLIYETPQLMMV